MADLVGGMLDFVSTFDVRQKRVRRGEVLDDFNKKLRLLVMLGSACFSNASK
ncbi:MAG: hypothetical protein ACLTQI_07855 [Slackia sp.]